jgi:hypothetical protein
VGTTIYRTRLELFEALYEQSGRSVREAVQRLAAAIERRGEREPYAVLETLVRGE